MGKKLFEDPRLSRDEQVSCATCHKPNSHFSDPGVPVSPGVFGRTGTRNTPALSNLAWRPYFMLDGGINHLEVLPLAPFTEPTEHDLEFGEVVRKVRTGGYRADFRRAYGDDSIYSSRLLQALAHYQLTLISDQTRWDSLQRGLARWTSLEEWGNRVFQKHCGSCHSGAQFSSFAFSQHSPLGAEDLGRSRVTQRPEDYGFYRIPSLRNWGWTAPYGHAGQWPTWEAAVQAFEQGQNASLTEKEKNALYAFLVTLNDPAP